MEKLSLEQIKIIRAVLRSIIPTIEVETPREKNEGDYMLAIFLGEKGLEDYKNGYDSEDLILWPDDNMIPASGYSFSYNVHDNGVYRRADGTGEPPSDEMVDLGETFQDLKSCVAALAKFILEMSTATARESIAELEIYHDKSLGYL